MDAISLVRHGHTALLTMNRGERRNSLDIEMRTAFASTIARVRDDHDVKVVVLTGSGGHFCAGGDVKVLEQRSLSKSDAFAARRSMFDFYRWFDELVALEKPLICAVDGVAFGAGLSLALTADFVMSTARASFCSVFGRIGLVPDLAAMYLLPRRVGLPAAKEMVFSTRVVGASEAKAMGLVDQLVDGPAEQLIETALAFAQRFHNASTPALGLAKTLMNRTFETSRETLYEQEAQAQAICLESEFHAEAVRRFLAKEPAMFTWP